MTIPLLDLGIKDKEIRHEIDRVLSSLLDSASYIGGEPVSQFAREFAQYCGGGTCVPLANGTDALILALKGLGIGSGDEVITVPFTFIATTEAISNVGATIRFVDINPKNYTMDVIQLEKAMTSKTKAIIPVHLFGQPCDMDPIMKLAKQKNIKVIEDAAQAHGAEYKGKRVGSFGDVACFSFYPTKNLGAYGDAGAVVCRSKEIADKISQLANHGRSAQYEHAVEGINSRLDTFQAAILRILLPRLDSWNERRRQIAQQYETALKNHPAIRPAYIEPYAKSVFHLYCVESPYRAELMMLLKEKGIGHGVYYPIPLHLQPAYAKLGLKKGDFPVSENASQHILALPMYPALTDANVKEIIKVLTQFKPSVSLRGA